MKEAEMSFNIPFTEATWQGLRRWLLAEIDKEKDRLCGEQTHEETLLTRGAIRGYKNILGLESRHTARVNGQIINSK